MSTFKSLAGYFLKGAGMGAANVIPGVSGGTIALITGIFERLINALKSIDLVAIRLFFTGRWRAFAEKIDFVFLLVLFSGIGISIISIAKLLKFLFEAYPVYVWSFFFGLILASVYFVGKKIPAWKATAIVLFILGAALAIFITFANPAVENSSFLYLFICGIVAVCSMILPGISGSFILLLMGNYELVMIRAVSDFNLQILFPVVLGAIFGLIAFSHFLSWLFRKFPGQTLATLTGFMFGSLLLLWPWKEMVYRLTAEGQPLLNRSGEPVPESYRFWFPEIGSELFIGALCVLAGFILILLLETKASKKE